MVQEHSHDGEAEVRNLVAAARVVEEYGGMPRETDSSWEAEDVADQAQLSDEKISSQASAEKARQEVGCLALMAASLQYWDRVEDRSDHVTFLPVPVWSRRESHPGAKEGLIHLYETAVACAGWKKTVHRVNLLVLGHSRSVPQVP